MVCPSCGAPVRADDTRCEACRHPLVGEAGSAPRGSGPPAPERSPRRVWSTAVWGVLVTVIVTAAILAVLAL